MCSILSLRLFVDEDTMSSLNLYSTEGDAFDDTDVALATGVRGPRRRRHPGGEAGGRARAKAESRGLIGQAMGMIMARSGVGADEAFEMLRAASQRTNEKLLTVAQRIVERKPAEQPPQ